MSHLNTDIDLPSTSPRGTGPLSPWILVFVAVSVVLSFVLGVSVRLATGLSNAVWGLFCANVAISGLLAGWILRRFLHVEVLAWRTPALPISFLWAAIFALLGVFGPERFRSAVTGVVSIILSIRTIFHTG